MLYQLPSGRTISISLDDFLSMSDQELNQLSNRGLGEAIQDPFYDSNAVSRKKVKAKSNDLDFEQEYEDPTKDPVLRIEEPERKEDYYDLPEPETEDIE